MYVQANGPTLAVKQPRLPTPTHLIVGQTSSRKDGDLLASGDAVHAVDGGDAGLDHLLRVDTALGVDWLAWKNHGGEHR